MNLLRKGNIPVILFSSLMILSGIVVLASSTSKFNLTINPGTLGIDIVDADDNYTSIDSPIYKFNNVSSSMDCLTGENAPSLTLGSPVLTDCDIPPLDPENPPICANDYMSGGYIYVQNPDAADGGWTASIAASGGNQSVLDSCTGRCTGNEPMIDYNDSTTGGCEDGGIDIDYSYNESYRKYIGGQMSIDTSLASISNGKCQNCSTTGISLGSSSAFEHDVVDSITLAQASSSASQIADYTLQGFKVTQTIPAGTPAADYFIDMTLSIIASGGGVSGPSDYTDQTSCEGAGYYWAGCISVCYGTSEEAFDACTLGF